MLTIFTSGPSKITVSALGRGPGPLIALAGIGGAAWFIHRYAKTIDEALTIGLVSAFAVAWAVVVVMTVLVVRRIAAEVRASRRAAAVSARPAVRLSAPVAPELANRRRAVEASPVITVRAEQVLDPARRGQR